MAGFPNVRRTKRQTLPHLTHKSYSWGGVLIRYTTDYDNCETQDWWYVIKDNPYDISKLKSKQRWVVKQGEKNFDVKLIDPISYKEEIFNVAVAAFSAYPVKYRPVLIREQYYKDIEAWKNYTVYGAFFRETGLLAGFCVLIDNGSYIGFAIQKTNPEYERYQVNAALIYRFLLDFTDELSNGKYICNGARNILHETGFNDYLIKYFGFRKAYCKLNLIISPKIKWFISLMFPFRKLFYKFDNIGKIHQMNGIFRMKEVILAQKKR